MSYFYFSALVKMAGAPPNLPLGSFYHGGHPMPVPLPPPGGATRGNGTSTPSSALQTSKTPSPSDLRALSAEGIDCYGNERQMLQEMSKFFNNDLLSDVKLRVGEQVFFAHKLILVRSSDVFERMLTSDWQDASKQVFEKTNLL